MILSRKRSAVTILLALVLVFSFATSAFALPTAINSMTGTSSSPDHYAVSPTILGWQQPSNTTHYSIYITGSSCGGCFFYSEEKVPQFVAPGSEYNVVSLAPAVVTGLPRNTLIKVLLITWESTGGGGYALTGQDEKFFIIDQ